MLVGSDGLYTKGTRAHTHRELIREWPSGQSEPGLCAVQHLGGDAQSKGRVDQLAQHRAKKDREQCGDRYLICVAHVIILM